MARILIATQSEKALFSFSCPAIDIAQMADFDDSDNSVPIRRHCIWLCSPPTDATKILAPMQLA